MTRPPITEIIRSLSANESQHAYYSMYDDKEAKKDREAAAQGIKYYQGLLDEWLVEVEAMRAILREITAGDPLIDDGSSTKPARACRYCGQARASTHYEYRPGQRVHADDCLYVRVRALLVEG